MTMNRMSQTPAVGATVYTSDNEELGTVKEIQGARFKVDAPMQPDYWLRCDDISTNDADRVLLSFTKERLGDYKSDSPDETSGDDAATRATSASYRPWNDVSSDYRRDWETRSGASGRRWEDDEPYHRYGYEMANDTRYHNREWNDAESDLRSGYRDWSSRSGYQDGDDSAWERGRDRAREAWERARRRN